VKGNSLLDACATAIYRRATSFVYCNMALTFVVAICTGTTRTSMIAQEACVASLFPSSHTAVYRGPVAIGDGFPTTMSSDGGALLLNNDPGDKYNSGLGRCARLGRCTFLGQRLVLGVVWVIGRALSTACS
jgi:hypothetical protein